LAQFINRIDTGFLEGYSLDGRSLVIILGIAIESHFFNAQVQAVLIELKAWIDTMGIA